MWAPDLASHDGGLGLVRSPKVLLITVLIILTEKQTRIPYAHELCVLWLVGGGVDVWKLKLRIQKL